MNRPIVFHLSEEKIGKAGSIKLLYVEYLDYWQTNKKLSAMPVNISLSLRYHLHIGTQIVENVFQIASSKQNEQDFIDAGFVQDPNFDKMFREYVKVQK